MSNRRALDHKHAREDIVDLETDEAIQNVAVIGPFPFAFDSPNIGNQYKLCDLDAGTVVLRVWIDITTAFDGDSVSLQIGLGGPDWDDPDNDWATLLAPTIYLPGPHGNGYRLEPSDSVSTTEVGWLTTSPGVLVAAFSSGGNGTQGQANAYALVMTAS